jgi:peptidoglycan/LPS O-acetylase OafA/YrhL
MSAPKIFILVLFLLALLFVIAINIGATHTDDQTFQTPAWLTGFGNLLASPQPLKLTDLQPSTKSCLQPGKLVVATGTTCVFAIQESSFTQRVISLRFVQGASATLMLTNQEGILPIQQPLTKIGDVTNTDLKVYPGKAHAMFSITCPNAVGGGASSCVLAAK